MANSTPRGIRNNNPLNLRISSNQWLGKCNYNSDGAFEQFTAIEYGLRAAMRNIATIVNRRSARGLKTTVRDLIHTWAPAADGNNELVYCRTIADFTNIQSNDEVNIKSKQFMCWLVYGMAFVENGETVSMQKIESAYYLAFGNADNSKLSKPQGNTDDNRKHTGT